MLHAAAMFTGLLALWLAFAPLPRASADWLASAFVCAACVVIAALWRGKGDQGGAPNLRWAWLVLARTPAALIGALSTMRAALAADVTLTPALVRLRLRSAADQGRADMAYLVSTSPGVAVVDIDQDGLLAHVLQEESIDAGDLSGLEARFLGAAR